MSQMKSNWQLFGTDHTHRLLNGSRLLRLTLCHSDVTLSSSSSSSAAADAAAAAGRRADVRLRTTILSVV